MTTDPTIEEQEANQSILGKIDSELDTGGASNPVMTVQNLLGGFLFMGALGFGADAMADAGAVTSAMDAGQIQIIGGDGPANGVFQASIDAMQATLQPNTPAPTAPGVNNPMMNAAPGIRPT